MLKLIMSITALSLSFSSHAKIIDLGNPLVDSDTINGGIFSFDDQQPTGTGVIDSFLRIQESNSTPNNALQEGYNTTRANANDYGFDEKHGNFTKDIQFSSLVSNSGFIEFLLDINEGQGQGQGSDDDIVLENVQIWKTDAGGQLITDNTQFNTLSNSMLIWDMDVGVDGDSSVLLDSSRAGSGSGAGDMLLSLPDTLFSNVGANDYIVFYSSFTGMDSGFEEWATLDRKTPETCQQDCVEVSEPSHLGFIALALFGFAMRARIKK